MATSTFEREIEITNPDAVERLEKLMSDETPGYPVCRRPFAREEQEWAEAALRRCPLRSPR